MMMMMKGTGSDNFSYGSCVLYTKNCWGRIISKDMRPGGPIIKSASIIYKVDLVNMECVLPPRCDSTAKIPSLRLAFLALVAAIFDWVRNSWTDLDSVFKPLSNF